MLPSPRDRTNTAPGHRSPPTTPTLRSHSPITPHPPIVRPRLLSPPPSHTPAAESSTTATTTMSTTRPPKHHPKTPPRSPARNSAPPLNNPPHPNPAHDDQSPARSDPTPRSPATLNPTDRLPTSTGDNRRPPAYASASSIDAQTQQFAIVSLPGNRPPANVGILESKLAEVRAKFTQTSQPPCKRANP
jgi:hypothetical protein